MTRNILILQGPIGPFMGRFAKDLRTHGFTVYKVNFNGGDQVCYRGPNPLAYTGRPDDFPEYLKNLLQSLNIERIYLFGDTRLHHEQARRVSRELGVRVFVFEEGYLRPDYLTLEEDGVNAYSVLPRDPEFYRPWENANFVKPKRIQNGFAFMAMWAVIYYIAASLLRWKYPYYRHHRPLNVLGEGSRWILGFLYKIPHAVMSRIFTRWLLNRHRKNYFLVPLQVHCDGQILRHSQFDSVAEFIQEVIRSFAKYSSKKHLLVIKHHPLDRPYHNYRRLIRNAAKAQGVDGRVFYVHDLHLPTLLEHALGTILINSTVGLSSLYHDTPVIALSNSVYNIPGLTHQGSLASFWKHPGIVDFRLNKAFRSYLIAHNQINGSFYRCLPGTLTHSGLVFPTDLWKQHIGVMNPAQNRGSFLAQSFAAETAASD